MPEPKLSLLVVAFTASSSEIETVTVNDIAPLSVMAAAVDAVKAMRDKHWRGAVLGEPRSMNTSVGGADYPVSYPGADQVTGHVVVLVR